MMKIELFYFEGCPTYLEVSENLRKAMAELGIQENLQIIEVIDPQDAVNKKFLGSPTIKINDIDLEHKDGDYVFGCRVYTIDGKLLGTPSKKYIKLKLSDFL